MALLNRPDYLPNLIENAEIIPHTYGHLIFDKEAKTIQKKKKKKNQTKKTKNKKPLQQMVVN
jgi:hypothetical protein